jgi:hypothetical protein
MATVPRHRRPRRFRFAHHRGTCAGCADGEQLGAAILFGVGVAAVWAWRKAFGVSRWGTEGSRRLLQQNSRAGAEAVKAKEWTAAERRAKQRMNQRLRLARHLPKAQAKRWEGRGWTVEQDSLLGTMPDEQLAAKIGRSVGAVRCRRTGKGIATFCDRRRRQEAGRLWP